MSSQEKCKVSVFIASSLDGYIARPDGDVDWLQQGYQVPKDEDCGYHEFLEDIDIIVMGLYSFEKVLTFQPWPYDKPVIVMSHQLKEVPASLVDRVRIVDDSPRELIASLSAEGIAHIYLDGGRLIQSFLRQGLVDELTITTIPVLLGQGRPLFGDLNADIPLQLLESEVIHDALVKTTYEVKR